MMKKFLFLILFLSIAISYSFDEIPVPENIYEIAENFRESYTGEAFDYSQKDPSWFYYATQRLLYWFLSLLRFISPTANVGSIWYYLKNSFLIIITISAVYFILKYVFKKEGVWIFKRKTKEEEIDLNENIEEHIDKIDLSLLIKKAIQNEQYRLAVRYYYLSVLKKLNNSGIIEIDNQKTNADYLFELEGGQLEDNFKTVSYLYNYIWYGEFEIDADKFSNVKNSFDETLNKIA